MLHSKMAKMLGCFILFYYSLDLSVSSQASQKPKGKTGRTEKTVKTVKTLKTEKTKKTEEVVDPNKTQCAFLENDSSKQTYLIDRYLEATLTTNNLLNWSNCDLCPKLYPLFTSGDGNCLLHAVSLCLYGHEDTPPQLRKQLYDYINEPQQSEIENIKRRWRYQEVVNNHIDKISTLSEDEWNSKWLEILEMAKPTEKMKYLESIHIFFVANLIFRPIIVIADKMIYSVIDQQPLAENCIGGVYLPFAKEAEACKRNPLVISFHASHFSAICFEQNTSFPAQIPLTYANKQFLPLKFAINPPDAFDFNAFENEQGVEYYEQIITRYEHIGLLEKYIDVKDATAFNGPHISADISKIEENAGILDIFDFN